MHIGIICNEYPPAVHGGTGSSYRDLAEGLVAAGHHATVVGVYQKSACQDRSNRDQIINGVRVVRLTTSPSFLRYKAQSLADRFRITQWLRREHRENRFDLIEASDYGGWLRFGPPAGVPAVVRIRGANFFFDDELGRQGDAFEHRLEKAALARADFVGSVSDYAAKRTLKLAGLQARAYTVIPNAVDTDLFSPSPDLPMERGLVVFVNSINPKKGIEQLIDGMNQIFPSYPNAKLVVIGEDTQKETVKGSYVERLRNRIHPEFKSRVVFTGRMDRTRGVVEYLQRAHLCCFPSHMETFGIAVIEAMAVGKPTIYSRTGPGPEVVEDGVSGLLCNPHDSSDVARQICRLLDDDDLALELGRGARKCVLSHFNKIDWVPGNIVQFERWIEESKVRRST